MKQTTDGSHGNVDFYKTFHWLILISSMPLSSTIQGLCLVLFQRCSKITLEHVGDMVPALLQMYIASHL